MPEKKSIFGVIQETKKGLEREKEEFGKELKETHEKVTIPAMKGYEEAFSKFKEHTTSPLPKFPELEGIPTAPKKPDLNNVWEGMSSLGKLAVNLALIAVTLKHGGEAYLDAFNSFVDAVRKRKKEDFEIARAEFEDKLKEISARNQQLIAEFNAQLELAKLGDTRAINWLNANYQNYQLALTAENNIRQQITKLDEIKAGIDKAILQRETELEVAKIRANATEVAAKIRASGDLTGAKMFEKTVNMNLKLADSYAKAGSLKEAQKYRDIAANLVKEANKKYKTTLPPEEETPIITPPPEKKKGLFGTLQESIEGWYGGKK